MYEVCSLGLFSFVSPSKSEQACGDGMSESVCAPETAIAKTKAPAFIFRGQGGADLSELHKAVPTNFRTA